MTYSKTQRFSLFFVNSLKQSTQVRFSIRFTWSWTLIWPNGIRYTLYINNGKHSLEHRLDCKVAEYTLNITSDAAVRERQRSHCWNVPESKSALEIYAAIAAVMAECISSTYGDHQADFSAHCHFWDLSRQHLAAGQSILHVCSSVIASVLKMLLQTESVQLWWVTPWIHLASVLDFPFPCYPKLPKLC